MGICKMYTQVLFTMGMTGKNWWNFFPNNLVIWNYKNLVSTNISGTICQVSFTHSQNIIPITPHLLVEFLCLNQLQSCLPTSILWMKTNVCEVVILVLYGTFHPDNTLDLFFLLHSPSTLVSYNISWSYILVYCLFMIYTSRYYKNTAK